MSMLLLLRRMALPVAGMILLCGTTAAARIISVNLLLAPPVDSPAAVHVLVIMDPVRKISFADSYAGLNGLGSRITDLEAFDGSDKPVAIRRIAPGQFETDSEAVKLSYSVDVRPKPEPSDSAHLSWLTNTRGVLLLSDLLPVNSGDRKSNIKVRFRLPFDWTAHSVESQETSEQFIVNDCERAVFAVGYQLRASQKPSSGMTVEIVIDGEWAFRDAEALDLAVQIINAHRDVFGKMPAARSLVVLMPFPETVAAYKWAAETRGSTVTLLMGKLPSKVAALAQLSTPLTHESFHLWIPNALELKGNYDWFYEGFTIYQASQTTVKLGLLSFPQFLDSIARAFDASKNDTSLSLIEASVRRFTGGGNAVYAKGQVVAFLYDLKLRSASHNKRSLATVYRRLMSSGEPAYGMDGSERVAGVLSEQIGSQAFVDSFVRKPVSINLVSELAPFGLIVDTSGIRTRISVSEKLSKQQRDLLGELGYNAATHAR
jgi:predicted metalloprotease with PDZ domain